MTSIPGFTIILVNGRPMRGLADLELVNRTWWVRARLDEAEDHAYVTELFSRSRGTISLELEAPQQDTLNHYRGQALIELVALHPTKVVQFQGSGPLERLDPTRGKWTVVDSLEDG